MRPEYIGGNVRAYCPDCRAITSFEHKHEGNSLSTVIINKPHRFEGENYDRTLHMHLRCASCHRGGMAKVHDNGKVSDGTLEEFFPFSVHHVDLPSALPEGIQAEFREAELCSALNANRAASALYRSVLEKTLKANGYTKGTLEKKIDDAAADGILTESRRRRAHDDIRVLGNDVLHDEWHEVPDTDVDDAARYAQRITEDFYDDRDSVEATLLAKNRIKNEEDAQPEDSPDAE
jgi:hypothetical protein